MIELTLKEMNAFECDKYLNCNDKIKDECCFGQASSASVNAPQPTMCRLSSLNGCVNVYYGHGQLHNILFL